MYNIQKTRYFINLLIIIQYFIIIPTVDVPDYCVANPKDVLPDPDNCAHFFDCNNKTTMVHRAAHVVSIQSYTKECQYPDLFDSNNRQCRLFTAVKCETRPEPMTPCKYIPLILIIS